MNDSENSHLSKVRNALIHRTAAFIGIAAKRHGGHAVRDSAEHQVTQQGNEVVAFQQHAPTPGSLAQLRKSSPQVAVKRRVPQSLWYRSASAVEQQRADAQADEKCAVRCRRYDNLNPVYRQQSGKAVLSCKAHHEQNHALVEAVRRDGPYV